LDVVANDSDSKQPNDPEDWKSRWSSWVDLYNSALIGNVTMNAINKSDLGDAIAEVDATKANTPAFSIDDAMARIWEYEAMNQITEGLQDVTEINDDSEVEIWRTRGDARVCEDCDENEGLSIDEADGVIPYHPNCNCYYQMVPKDFADLLADGNEDDRALAHWMDAKGVVPNAMLVRGADGRIAGKVIVDFQDWMEGAARSISGNVQ
jgi:hypothetical protein